MLFKLTWNWEKWQRGQGLVWLSPCIKFNELKKEERFFVVIGQRWNYQLVWIPICKKQNKKIVDIKFKKLKNEYSDSLIFSLKFVLRYKIKAKEIDFWIRNNSYILTSWIRWKYTEENI
jgi:hypothetical protein